MPFELFATIGAIIGLGAIEKTKDKEAAKARELINNNYYFRDMGNPRQRDLISMPFMALRDVYIKHYGKDCPGIELAWKIGEMNEVYARTTIVKNCMMYGIMEAEHNPIDRTGRWRCWYCYANKYQCRWYAVRQLPILKHDHVVPEKPYTNPAIFNDSQYNKWD